jgi:hypothetical protein
LSICGAVIMWWCVNACIAWFASTPIQLQLCNADTNRNFSQETEPPCAIWPNLKCSWCFYHAQNDIETCSMNAWCKTRVFLFSLAFKDGFLICCLPFGS